MDYVCMLSMHAWQKRPTENLYLILPSGKAGQYFSHTSPGNLDH